MLKILVIGATSLIAQETMRYFAADKAEFFLVGLSAEKLKAIQDDLLVRGAKRVETYLLDLTRLDKHQEMLDAAMEALGVIDAVLVAHGTLTD
ncbi:MAG: SDR family NAD(P)-dependent oxidoreductase, partial [Anaerolineae bacterium]|nr:SDR family NAD(P)-dependent oxidoreductase [Anaerolineae bacterium]